MGGTHTLVTVIVPGPTALRIGSSPKRSPSLGQVDLHETPDGGRQPGGHPDVMSKVLVAYASKRGSTAEIAEAIADKLREFSLSVDCLPAEKVSSLEPYDAVVLGSAVYINRWQGDARHFLREHAGELSKLPFWVFSSGPVGDPSTADPAALEPARIVDKVEDLGVRGHVVFGGRLPTEPHGPFERGLVRHTPRGYRDRRNWGEIIEWAARIAGDLTTHLPA